MRASRVVTHRVCCAVIVAGLLSACVATPPISPSSMESPVQWFGKQRSWEAMGRVALSDGERGGQLTIEWTQQDDTHAVYLRNRLGTHWWRLAYDAAGATLVGYDGMVMQGPKPDQIASDAVGWPIPVKAMSFWLRGLVGPGDREIERDDNGQLLTLQQGEWRVQFSAHRPIATAEGSRVMLPSRMEISSPPYRIRVVLNEWDWPKSVSGP